MPDSLLTAIRQDLLQNIDVATKHNASSFFKEEVKFYGVKISVVSKLAQHYLPAIKHLSKSQVFELIEQLLQSGFTEEAFIAFEFAYSLRTDYQPEDFAIFEKWLHLYVTNWATCDTLCNHTIGTFIELYPDYLPRLSQWAASPNRWLRRAAAVTLILPARKGLFIPQIFMLADMLLLDPDDLVQKGYGWMLKEASKAHQQEVFTYVMEHKAIMPRTALRYAIEKMPPDLRRQAMAKD